MRLSLHHHLYDSGRALVLDGIRDLTDADLAQLRDLSLEQRTNIQVLVLSHTPVTNRCIRHLRVLPNLKGLYLHGTGMTDDAPLELLPVGIELVNLDDTRVGDQVVAKLSRLPRLRTLHLRNTEVTDCGAYQLRGVDTLRNLCVTETAVSDLAKRRMDNSLLLKSIGCSTALWFIQHHVGRLLRVLTLQIRPNPLKLR